MRKVFLDDLPRTYKGIDWSKTINMNVRFIYDEIEGFVSIIKYNKNNKNINIKYNDIYFDINVDGFKKCALGNLVGKYTSKFKYDIGYKLNDSNRDMVIINRERRKLHRTKNGYEFDENEKWYEYKCNTCGYIGWFRESGVKKSNCRCCTGQIIVDGINTLYDTDKWVISLGVSIEDAKKHSKGSKSNIKVICPYCKTKKNISINQIIANKSISCICNSDGFSYPEKFMYSVLKQLNIEFETQLSRCYFEWCDKYKYDFYIPSLNIIIETHGGQHYSDTNGFKLSLDEVINNDKVKKEIALKNNIKYYIIIDCRKSSLDWIKNNILNSKLSEIFDLSHIDWLECESFAIKYNFVKSICDYFNKHQDFTIVDIAKAFDIKNRMTIRKYLNYGAKLGWCEYSPEIGKVRGVENSNKVAKIKFSKQVEVFKDDVSLGIFVGVNELARQSEELFGVKMYAPNISAVCLGKYDAYKGFTFKYVNTEEICAS